MARVVEQDWGFAEVARRFEHATNLPKRPPLSSRCWSSLPSLGAAHVIVWLSMVALSLIGLVTLHVIILQKNVEHNNLIRQKNALTAENAKLSSDVSALSSPERIEAIATNSLGMVRAEKMQYVYISPPEALQSYAYVEGPDPGRLTTP